jgi:hypothetical protein
VIDQAGDASSATSAVLDAARRCAEGEASGDAGSLLEAVRVFEDLIVAARVGQVRVLSRLTVVESAAFALGAVFPGDGVPLGREVVTAQEIATVLEVSVESVRTRLAVAETLAVMPTVCAAAEAGLLRWWQVRRTVEAAWRLPAATQAALDTHMASLATEGRLRGGFAATLNRVVLDLDPELAERSLADALAERAVMIRPDQDVPGMGRVGATVPAEGAITVAAGLDRLADTAISQPPPGLPAEGRTADNRRADCLSGSWPARWTPSMRMPAPTPRPVMSKAWWLRRSAPRRPKSGLQPTERLARVASVASRVSGRPAATDIGRRGLR